MARHLSWLWLGLLMLPATLGAESYVRVYTMGRSPEGKLMRVIRQPAMLWEDSKKLREAISAGVKAIREDASLSLDANEQLKLLLDKLPPPDATATTDINGQAMLTDVEVARRYLVIVQNNLPYHQGGGPFVGIKQPGSQRVRCNGVDLNGLLTFLERYQRRPLPVR